MCLLRVLSVWFYTKYTQLLWKRNQFSGIFMTINENILKKRKNRKIVRKDRGMSGLRNCNWSNSKMGKWREITIIRNFFYCILCLFYLLSNSQYLMSYFFLCGLKRLCATLSFGSRKYAENAKVKKDLSIVSIHEIWHYLIHYT